MRVLGTSSREKEHVLLVSGEEGIVEGNATYLMGHCIPTYIAYTAFLYS
jgi:hypothetical protein